MINFAVINIKSAIKNFSKIIIALFLIIGIVDLSNLIKNNNIKFSYINLVKSCINFDFDNKKENKNSLEKAIFFKEMPILAASQNIDSNEANLNMENENFVNEASNEVVSNNSETLGAEENKKNSDTSSNNLRNLQTEVISENNISESYNTLYGSVKIKNETSFVLNNEVLTPNVEFSNKNDVVIFHTHTCESYTQTEANSYVASRKF